MKSPEFKPQKNKRQTKRNYWPIFHTILRPTSREWEFLLLCMSEQRLTLSELWAFAISVVRSELIVILIFNSLMTDDIEHPFMCSLANRVSSLTRCRFKCFAHLFRWAAYFLGNLPLSYVAPALGSLFSCF
jgi:hypothetical protein